MPTLHPLATRDFRGIAFALGLAIWSAAAMTFGDWLWAALELRHRPQYGLAHGTLLCLWMGLYLGFPGGLPARGAALGALVGFLAAGSFYALSPLAGYAAMFVSWIGLWFGMAWVAMRLLGGERSPGRALIRAAVAAIASALAFYAVSGIWLSPSPVPDYSWHFVAWTVAFAPGCLVIASKGTKGPKDTTGTTGTEDTDDEPALEDIT